MLRSKINAHHTHRAVAVVAVDKRRLGEDEKKKARREEAKKCAIDTRTQHTIFTLIHN